MLERLQWRKGINLPFWRVVLAHVHSAELQFGYLRGFCLQRDDVLVVFRNLHLGKAQANDAQYAGCCNTDVDAILAAKGPAICYADNDFATVFDILYLESGAKGEGAGVV